MIVENKVYFFSRFDLIENKYLGSRILSREFFEPINRSKSNEFRCVVHLVVKDHPSRDALPAIEFMRCFAIQCVNWILLYGKDKAMVNKIKFFLKNTGNIALKGGVDKHAQVLGMLISGMLTERETTYYRNAVADFVWLVDSIESAHGYLRIENRTPDNQWLQKQITG